MNIGIDIRALDTLYTTGVDTYLRAILKQWLDHGRGHRFILFGTKDLRHHDLVRAFLAAGHRFIEQPWPNKLFNASIKFFKRPFLDKLVGGVDVFFFPNTMFHAVSSGGKSVITFHDLSFERLKSIYSLKHNLWHWLVNPRLEAEQASAVIAVSAATAHDLNYLYQISMEKIRVVPLGVDGPKYAASVNGTIRVPQDFILFMGSVEPRKNILALVKAFARVRDRYPKLHLVIAGGFFPQKDKYVLKYVKGDARIFVTGPVDEANKIYLYQRARLTVLPSLYEGFGLPILESQAAGTPVITAVSSAMPEASRGAALLVNPLNTTELAQAIDVLMANSELYHLLVSRGRAAVQALTWQQTAEKTLDVLESV